MVDKTVDAEWKKQGSLQRSLSTTGTPPLPVTLKTPEGIWARILVMLTAFFMTLFTMLCTVASHETGKIPRKLPSNDQNTSGHIINETPKEECDPPSPTVAVTQVDGLSSILERLRELEEKH